MLRISLLRIHNLSEAELQDEVCTAIMSRLFRCPAHYLLLSRNMPPGMISSVDRAPHLALHARWHLIHPSDL